MFLNNNNIIYNLQFGFMQQHFTSHALLINITENIRKALDDGNIGCGIFVDLEKAFDTVDHQILLAKLNHYGIRGISNDWFKSYLSNSKSKQEVLCDILNAYKTNPSIKQIEKKFNGQSLLLHQKLKNLLNVLIQLKPQE